MSSTLDTATRSFLDKFCEARELNGIFMRNVESYFLDYASRLSQRAEAADKPIIVGLNGAQVDGLSQQKDAIRADREIVSACMRQIQLLRTHVAEHINSSQRVTDELRRILEPTQVATFLLWVERNQRSMNLLNSIVATDSTD